MAMAWRAVAFAQLLFGNREGQVASLDTVLAFDEALAAPRPGVRLADVATRQEREREPERAAGGVDPVARLVEGAVLALEEPQKRGFLAAQARSRGQPVESASNASRQARRS
jgi:hypothetical protein